MTNERKNGPQIHILGSEPGGLLGLLQQMAASESPEQKLAAVNKAREKLTYLQSLPPEELEKIGDTTSVLEKLRGEVYLYDYEQFIEQQGDNLQYVIHKLEIPISDTGVPVRFPIAAKLHKIDHDPKLGEHYLAFWYMFPLGSPYEQTFDIYAFGTGQPISKAKHGKLTSLATVITPRGLVWHVFGTESLYV